MTQNSLSSARDAAAEVQFALYDFGDYEIEGRDGFEYISRSHEVDPVEYNATVYYALDPEEMDEDDEPCTTGSLVFKVLFAPNSDQVLEAYALNKSTGDMV
jgi:hypothetical protein